MAAREAGYVLLTFRAYETVVKLGVDEIPRGTLGRIFELAGLTIEEFQRYL